MGRKPSGIRPFSFFHSPAMSIARAGVFKGGGTGASENRSAFAEVPQTPFSPLGRLRKFRKRHFLLFHACGSSANTTFPFWTLAEVPQTPLFPFSCLRKFRKGHFLHFDACGSSASASGNALAFATPLQGKHFQKRFALFGGMSRRVSALIGPIQAQAARQPASLRANLPFNGVSTASSPPAGVRVRTHQWSERCFR